MSYALILCRSVTQAQRALKCLSVFSVPGRMFRSPLGLTDRGCSYSVRIRERDAATAIHALEEWKIRPLKILVQRADGGYDEVPR